MINQKVAVAVAFAIAGLTGCAMTSDVMDGGDGTYLISAHASAIRGGATGANSVAYQDAQKFCIQKDPQTHAIVVNSQERDVYQSSGTATLAAGNVNFRFKCGA